MSTGRNTFAEQSDGYARARPQYPGGLFEWIAGQCKHHRAAWDCATGNGQAAVGLARYFDQVDATDISAEQIRYVTPHPRIRYSVAVAESSGFPDGAFDVITVAQALHWFQYERFWPEIIRVATAEAFFCAWGYSWPDVSPAVDNVLVEPVRDILYPFWAPQNRILQDGYQNADICFPFVRIDAPSFVIELQWTLEQLIDYMMTWSAFKLSRQDLETTMAMDTVLSHARSALSDTKTVDIRMPLSVVAGRIHGYPGQ